MKRKILVGLLLCLCTILCAIVLVACGDEISPYCGEYFNYDKSVSVKIEKDKIFVSGFEGFTTFTYENETLYFNNGTTAYLYDNYNVFAMTSYRFCLNADVSKRSGYFEKIITNRNCSFIFGQNGKYSYYDSDNVGLCHSGNYKYENGIITISGKFYLSQKSFNDYMYIDYDGKMFCNVLLKNTSNFFQNNPNDNNPPQNQDVFYSISYSAGEGGTIQGLTNQTVIENGNSESVTAVPNAGYEFTGWSDGVITKTRQEINVQSNMTITANFKTLSY